MSRFPTIALVFVTLHLLTTHNATAETKPLVELSIDDVIETEGCVVKRVAVNLPSGARVDFVNDVDQTQMGSSPAGEGRPTVHLNIVADLFLRRDGDQSDLKLIFNLSGGTLTRAITVGKKRKLNELVVFTLKPGKFELGKRIPVLNHGGRRFFLLVSMPDN